MNISDLKLAAYLEEAGDDLTSACATLVANKVNYVSLRNVWTGHICQVDDSTCAKLRSTLTNKSISVVSIISDLGLVPPSQLNKTPEDKIKRAFNVASYYGASQIRIGIGVKSKEAVTPEHINQWMQLITSRCLDANLVPILEISEESAVYQPADVAGYLAKHRRWKLLYDPVQFIIRQRQEPFIRYWTLLKSFVAGIDIRDYKIGVGYKPVGFGDAQIKLVLDDSVKNGFAGWYFLEPSLGRRHGSAVTK